MAPVNPEPGDDTPDEDRLDSEAIRRLLDGDERAFDELVERYTAPIYSLSYRMLGSTEAAEDAVQEIFTKVYRNAARFNPRRRFFSWLYTIALNHLRSRHRSRRRQFNSQAVEFDEQRGNPEGPIDHPEQELMRRQAEEHIQWAIQRLKPVHREVFLLRQMEELSVQETARILDIPENTVKTHLRRARKELRKQLADMGWE